MAPIRLNDIASARQTLDKHRAEGISVGFVPTMGYLHAGHGSLMAAARAANDVVVASIFVNPLQFAEGEDLSTYPRDLEKDTELAASHGVDYLFVPSVEDMYPNRSADASGDGVLTTINVEELSERWDGEARPTHFSGVATVVAKLFNIIGPCRAYFGEKDFQQLAIIRRLVHDLSIPVDVVGCPIVREADGLAMSSRNSYLSPELRKAATIVRRALDQAQAATAIGKTDPAALEKAMATCIASEPLASLDYAAVIDGHSLLPAVTVTDTSHLLIAAYLGKTRLIDNDRAINDSVDLPKGT